MSFQCTVLAFIHWVSYMHLYSEIECALENTTAINSMRFPHGTSSSSPAYTAPPVTFRIQCCIYAYAYGHLAAAQLFHTHNKYVFSTDVYKINKLFDICFVSSDYDIKLAKGMPRKILNWKSFAAGRCGATVTRRDAASTAFASMVVCSDYKIMHVYGITQNCTENRHSPISPQTWLIVNTAPSVGEVVARAHELHQRFCATRMQLQDWRRSRPKRAFCSPKLAVFHCCGISHVWHISHKVYRLCGPSLLIRQCAGAHLFALRGVTKFSINMPIDFSLFHGN